MRQIYVSMELSEGQIRILAGEYFNTRFNIIRADSYPCNAISDFKVSNREELVNEIRYAIGQSSGKIGADIKQVILVLPAYNFKRFPLKSKVFTSGNVITKQDIARAVSNSLKTRVDADVMVVSPMIVKYTVNGIATRRLPEKENATEMIVDIDLLCADIDVCYNFVSCVEESGIKVLDIVLNTYAIAKEAAFFEESLNKNLIILDVNRSCTYLSLISKGKLMSTEIVFDGLNSLINRVYRTYNIPYNDIPRLVKFGVDFETVYPEDVVYAWSDQGATRTLTAAMLNEAIAKPLDMLSDKLVTMCQPIIESGAEIILCGEGVRMRALAQILNAKANTRVRTYCPDTIGVRDPGFASLYGAFFVYRDKVLLNDLKLSCIDLLKYDLLIDERKFDQEGETITTKIKNLFRQYMEKGEN